MKNKHSEHSEHAEHGDSGGFLGAVERIGNRLPDPVTLFLLGALLVLVLSQLGAWLGWSAVNPTSGVEVVVTPLLSGEGLEWVWTMMVENFTGFAPLGVVLVAMLGIGVAERTGLIAGILGILIRITPRKLVIPGLSMLKVTWLRGGYFFQ